MCRLAAITTTNIDADTKQVIMHFMMTASAGDENQSYGAGVSDGDSVYKSGKSYIHAEGLAWLKELDPLTAWLGHVRKPSNGTSGASSFAAHPYALENKMNPFVLIHNGWVAGTSVARKDEPDTDSWRAAKALEHHAAGELLTPAVIQSWIRTFETGSSYSFLIVQDERLIGVRGHRTLYRFNLRNGWVINTSRVVLENVRAFTAMFVKDAGTIEEVPEGLYFDSTGTVETLDISTRPMAHEIPIVWQRKTQRRRVLRHD